MIAIRQSADWSRGGLACAACLLVLLVVVTQVSEARQIEDQWRYTLEAPGKGWQQPDFDDADWTEGHGGFGTRHTPGARVGTVWSTNDIWLRKTFSLDTVPDKPALLIHHDEDARVYVNGQLLATFKDYTVEYQVVPIAVEKRSLLRTGENVKVRDAEGHWRFTLNGEPIFHWGPLDQGWWPDGLLTPPSDEGMRFDIEFLKAVGFNMIRKHIKAEPRRYYYHCDWLGMMVWQDHVSGGQSPRGRDQRVDDLRSASHQDPRRGIGRIV